MPVTPPQKQGRSTTTPKSEAVTPASKPVGTPMQTSDEDGPPPVQKTGASTLTVKFGMKAKQDNGRGDCQADEAFSL